MSVDSGGHAMDSLQRRGSLQQTVAHVFYFFFALEICWVRILGRVSIGNAPDLLALIAPFGARLRASFSRRARNARSAAAPGARLRGGRVAPAGSSKRVSTLAKRRCALMSLRRPTIR